MNPPKRPLVRLHVVTGGRAHPSRNVLGLVTLLSAVRHSLAGLTPEQRRVMELCRGGALSVAEVAGHLALPVSVTKVLLSDLIDSGHLAARSGAPSSQRPSSALLQEVLNGLRARL
ncbi:DUF742 domain-containing protein [Actinocorallia longicatena]|uniref:DUF742 domain-containing protein n=1 Tax=Actinocorallia longicatena TaxID=111803 RepID=A0ABP6QMD5_9ACTN